MGRAIDLGPAPVEIKPPSNEELLYELQQRRYQSGRWVPGCNGTEEPFTFRGARYLYCWHTGTGEHAYIDLGTDMPMHRTWYPGSDQ